MTELLNGLDDSVWVVAEAFALVVLAIYCVFAMVVVRQVNHMTDTLEVGFEGVIRLAAWLHFILALGTLVVALVIL